MAKHAKKSSFPLPLVIISVLALAAVIVGVVFLTRYLGSASVANAEPAVTESPAPVIDNETISITMQLGDGEGAILDNYTALKHADLRGSTCLEDIMHWAQKHPEVAVIYNVPLPNGEKLINDAKSVDLSWVSDSDVPEVLKALKVLPDLRTIELGTERASLSLSNAAAICAACPNAESSYTVSIYGVETNLGAEKLDLRQVPVEDNGAAVEELMTYMPNLTYLDMDSCGLSDEVMAGIRDRHPNVKVVWRIWFGDQYTVRTDVERILASKVSVGGMLRQSNTQSLKYCTDVKYLDIGHNELLEDISFVAYMPKLEVAVLAMAAWSDCSALANCPNLEYLEMFTTNVSDLSPLKDLKNLRHLNIAYCLKISDITPLYGLTNLERLWIGYMDYAIPREQIDEIRTLLPNCEVNTDVGEDPTGGRWRYVGYNDEGYYYIYHDRYIKLKEQFGDYSNKAYSFPWNDPLCE